MKLNPSALATIRGLAGHSQASLARESGVSQSHISGLEAGDKKASPQTIVTLAKTLGVPVSSLLSDPEKASA